jgi:hypothetical protein
MTLINWLFNAFELAHNNRLDKVLSPVPEVVDGPSRTRQ